MDVYQGHYKMEQNFAASRPRARVHMRTRSSPCRTACYNPPRACATRVIRNNCPVYSRNTSYQASTNGFSATQTRKVMWRCRIRERETVTVVACPNPWCAHAYTLCMHAVEQPQQPRGQKQLAALRSLPRIRALLRLVDRQV